MAGGRNKINEHPNANTNGFGKRPHDAGAPKKLISHINAELKSEGYEPATLTHIKDAYMTLVNLPWNMLVKIANAPKDGPYPYLYTLVAMEMIGAKGPEMLERMLDRGVGKPTQSIDHTTNGKDINIPVIAWDKTDGSKD